MELKSLSESTSNLLRRFSSASDSVLKLTGGELLPQVRRRLNSRLATEYDRTDDTDVEWTNQNTWYIKRMIDNSGDDVEVTVNRLLEVLKWRKSLKVCEWDADRLPAEFHKAGLIFRHGHDVQQNHVVYIRIGALMYFTKLDPLFKEWIASLFANLDKDVRGFIVVLNLNYAVMKHYNKPLLDFILEAASMSAGTRRILIYNAPFWVKTALKVLKRHNKVPIVFVELKQLCSFIRSDMLPKSFGGNAEPNFPAPSPDSRFMIEMAAELKLNNLEFVKYTQYLKKFK